MSNLAMTIMYLVIGLLIGGALGFLFTRRYIEKIRLSLRNRFVRCMPRWAVSHLKHRFVQS